MQTTLEITGLLDRRLTGELAAERVDRAVADRLNSMAAQVHIAGFRPGKAPVALVQKKYGVAVRLEVLEKLLAETFQQATEEHGLRVAGIPRFSCSPPGAGTNPTFSATFQVYPQITLVSPAKLPIQRMVAQVQEADLDRMIEVIRKQHPIWAKVDRPAQTGDQVSVDYEGQCDGATFTDSHATKSLIELGNGRLPSDLEVALAGMRAGEQKDVAVNYPDSHPVELVRGKTARFHLKVRQVFALTLPTVDAVFIKKFQIGDGSLATFRAEVKNNMDRELQHVIRSQLKQQVLDGLTMLHTFAIPESLVAEELRDRRDQTVLNKHPLVDEQAELQARQQVKLRLILDEIIRQNGLRAEPSRVEAYLQDLASTCADPTALIDHYRSQQESMQQVENAVLEEMIVDWVLEQATITDVPTDFDAVMNSQPQRLA